MKHISTRAQFLLESEKKVIRRPDGSIQWEVWRENGVFHRLDGPAWIEYKRDGSINRERTEWWQEGKKQAPDPTWFARQELKDLGFSDEDADLIAPFF